MRILFLVFRGSGFSGSSRIVYYGTVILNLFQDLYAEKDKNGSL